MNKVNAEVNIMADLIINGSKFIKGKFSISRILDNTQHPPRLILQGQLETHRYFEELNTIESKRYRVSGVNVFQESFGSDDYSIIYVFNASDIAIKGGETYLVSKDVKELEEKLYGGDNDARDEREQQ
jgi:hypothetical protein